MNDKAFRKLKKQVAANQKSQPKPVKVNTQPNSIAEHAVKIAVSKQSVVVKPVKYTAKKPKEEVLSTCQKPSSAPGFSSFNGKKNSASLRNRLYNKI